MQKATELAGEFNEQNGPEGVEDHDEWILDDNNGFYRGQWKKNSNIREGKGLLVQADGSIMRGVFKDDKFASGWHIETDSRSKFKDCSFSVSSYENHKLHGQYLALYENG